MPGPLDGVRIIDLTTMISGPLATMILGDQFERAYDLYPVAEYLYNMGQAYRLLDDCRALGLYDRYLEAEPESKHRALVQRHIDAMSERCAARVEGDNGRSEKVGSTIDGDPPEPPEKPDRSAGEATGSESATGDGGSVSAGTTGRIGPPRVRRLFALAEAGLAFYGMGDVVAPTVATSRVGAGYSFGTGALRVDAGLSLEMAPMRFDSDPPATAFLWSALANLGVGYRPHHRWRIRAELGVGGLLFSGLSEGNPFTEDGQSSRPLRMLELRVAAGIDYRLGSRLELRLSPVVYTRSTRNDDLSQDIESISSLSLLAGIGARL